MGEIPGRREEEESLRWQKAGVTWQKVSVIVAVVIGFFTVWGALRSQGTATNPTYTQEAVSDSAQNSRIPAGRPPAGTEGIGMTPPSPAVQSAPEAPSLPRSVVISRPPNTAVVSRPPNVQVSQPQAAVPPRAPVPVRTPGVVSLTRYNTALTDGNWYHDESPTSIGGRVYSHYGNTGINDKYAIFDIRGWDRFTAVAGIQDSNGPCVAYETSKVLIEVDGKTVKTFSLRCGGEGQAVNVPLIGRSRLKISCLPGAVLAEPNLEKE